MKLTEEIQWIKVWRLKGFTPKRGRPTKNDLDEAFSERLDCLGWRPGVSKRSDEIWYLLQKDV